MGISGSEILRRERKEKGPKKSSLPTTIGTSSSEILRGEKKRDKALKVDAYCQQQWVFLGVRF